MPLVLHACDTRGTFARLRHVALKVVDERGWFTSVAVLAERRPNNLGTAVGCWDMRVAERLLVPAARIVEFRDEAVRPVLPRGLEVRPVRVSTSFGV